MKERDLILETTIVGFFETYDYVDNESEEYDYDSPNGEEEEEITFTIDTDFNFYFEGVRVDINIEELMGDNDPEEIMKDVVMDWFDGGPNFTYWNLHDNNLDDIYSLIDFLEPLYKGHLRSKKLELLGI